jgi:hypothetical protein
MSMATACNRTWIHLLLFDGAVDSDMDLNIYAVSRIFFSVNALVTRNANSDVNMINIVITINPVMANEGGTRRKGDSRQLM